MKLFEKLFEKIKKPFHEFRIWLLSKKMRRGLIKHFEQERELELLNEKWIIKRIQDGQVGRRKELAEKQAKIREVSAFVNFLRK